MNTMRQRLVSQLGEMALTILEHQEAIEKLNAQLAGISEQLESARDEQVQARQKRDPQSA